jgi:hypothetical protein
MLLRTVLLTRSHCASTTVTDFLGALAVTAGVDMLILMLTLFGANGASIAVAVASPNNTLFADFILPHRL